MNKKELKTLIKGVVMDVLKTMGAQSPDARQTGTEITGVPDPTSIGDQTTTPGSASDPLDQQAAETARLNAIIAAGGQGVNEAKQALAQLQGGNMPVSNTP